MSDNPSSLLSGGIYKNIGALVLRIFSLKKLIELSLIHATRLKKNNHNLSAYASIFFFAILIMISNSAISQKLISTREVLLKAGNEASIGVSSIKMTRDGNFIIVGRSGFDAWARKVDIEGKTIWEYTSDLRNQSTSRHEAIFHGIAEMPDGSVYLCGNVPVSSGGVISGLLSHLDEGGRLLNESLVLPKNPASRSGAYFSDCTQFGNKLVIVGQTSRWSEDKTGLSTWYWLQMLDASGKIVWEKEIPTLLKNFTPDIRGTTIASADNNLIFSVTDNVNSELININLMGDVQAHKEFPGRFQFVRPITPDGSLQIYGSSGSNIKPPRMVIALNNKFEEIQRVQGDQPANFGANLVYRMPDKSYVFFGTSIHSLGERLRSGIVHVDGALQSEQYSTSFDKDHFSDMGSIGAAIPIKNSDEFLIGRSLVRLGDGEKNPNDIYPGFVRGAVLNLMQLNPANPVSRLLDE
jgi:hypothetical protein